MNYTSVHKQRSNLRAKRLLGKVRQDDEQDYSDFMNQCIVDLLDSGEATDEDDAHDQCQSLWEDTGDAE